MRNKHEHERGFTFIEVVIALVVVGLLGSALARFVDFDSANKSAAQLNRQAIEAKWKTHQVDKIADTVSSRSTNLPSIADLTGYAEASTPEPAPDELPPLVSYSYWMLIPYDPRTTATVFSTDLLGYRPLNNPPFGTGINWQDPNGDGVSSCEELASGIVSPGFVRIGSSTASAGYAYMTQMTVEKTGEDVSASISDPVPRCVIHSLEYRRWCTSGGTCTVLMTDIPPAAAAQGLTRTQTTARSYDTDHSYNRILSPSFYRYTCQGHSHRYGAEYALPSNPGAIQLNITRTRTSDSPIYYEQTYSNVYLPDPPSYVKCIRQGPAPAVPPATDGNPGNPPPKADFSGVCVAKGWSVPTYGADGSPTSSASDPVARIGDITEDASCE